MKYYKKKDPLEMKPLFIGSIIGLVIIILVLLSKEGQTYMNYQNELRTYRYDGCEYVGFEIGLNLPTTLTHKGNCKNHKTK